MPLKLIELYIYDKGIRLGGDLKKESPVWGGKSIIKRQKNRYLF
jgi:hypothetical protein